MLLADLGILERGAGNRKSLNQFLQRLTDTPLRRVFVFGLVVKRIRAGVFTKAARNAGACAPLPDISKLSAKLSWGTVSGRVSDMDSDSGRAILLC
jgi:hypothetical protein